VTGQTETLYTDVVLWAVLHPHTLTAYSTSFYVPMPYLSPDKQHQGTEGT